MAAISKSTSMFSVEDSQAFSASKIKLGGVPPALICANEGVTAKNNATNSNERNVSFFIKKCY
jgi:hypothetical protein